MIPYPMALETKTRVMIVDDHRIFRDNLKRLILTLENFEVVAEAGGMSAGLHGVLWLVPDLVTVDISLPDRNGIFLTRQIKQRHPQIQVLVITVHSSRAYIDEALQAGANGYLLKASAADQALPAIQAVAGGRFYGDTTLPADWMVSSWRYHGPTPARAGDKPDAPSR